MASAPPARLLARLLPWHRPRVRVATVIGSDAHPLRQWENWRRIVPAMTALVDLLPKPATIRPWHYREGQSRAVPYGLMRWNEETRTGSSPLSPPRGEGMRGNRALGAKLDAGHSSCYVPKVELAL